MKLQVLSKSDCEQVRLWRNESLVALRTPYMLTQEQQEEFYIYTVSERNVKARFWGVSITITLDDGSYDKLIGMVGLENIEWENRRAEISIIINPAYQGAGYGEQAVDLLLEQGFMYLNLANIWAICYECNPAVRFWDSIMDKYDLGRESINIPNMKYWNGKYYNGAFFNITKEDWLKCRK